MARRAEMMVRQLAECAKETETFAGKEANLRRQAKAALQEAKKKLEEATKPKKYTEPA